MPKKPAAAAAEAVRALPSRIVGHADVAPDQLLANPRNFRRHPGEQLDAIRGSLGALGWIKTVLVNKRTGHVIDGHARIEEALRLELTTVPVTYLDLSDEEEKLALAVLDPISGLAYQDEQALAELLAEIGDAPNDELSSFLTRLSDEAAPLPGAGEDEPGAIKEYDETAADGVEMIECPACQHRFPK